MLLIGGLKINQKLILMKPMYRKPLRFNNLLVIALIIIAVKSSNLKSANESLVLIQSQKNNLYDNQITTVKAYFEDFIKLYQIDLYGANVDFIYTEGLNYLFKSLPETKYTNIFYIISGTKHKGYCELSEQLSTAFNKNVIFWPCPKMKKTQLLSPSYKAISFAVKSVSYKFNWTDAIIYTSVIDNEWGLPLAIAANLNVPYKIEIGGYFNDSIEMADDIGKVIIVTSTVDSTSALAILNYLENYKNVTIMFIDIIGSIFNSHFDEQFNQQKQQSNHTFDLVQRNIIVLTILSEKFKVFLNSSFKAEYETVLNASDYIIKNSTRLKRAAKNEEKFVQRNLIKIKSNIINLSNRNNLTVYDVVLSQIKSFVNNNCGMFCKKFIVNDIDFCAYLLRFQRKSEIQVMCKYLLSLGNENSKNKIRIYKRNIYLNQSSKEFVKYHNLFDFIVSKIVSKNISLVNTYDFIVMNLQVMISNNNKINMWRPFLVLHQHTLNEQYFLDQLVLPAKNDWLSQGSALFARCGVYCWSITLLTVILFLVSIAFSVAAGIAVRNYFLKNRLSKGPNKIVLSAAEFVFPIDTRRVDEGIEAMLCCWLQQLQEFGGPEVDKPDLLKGSIGSLKNIGLSSLNAKNNSGTGSLAKHSAMLDMRARYNGDLVQLKEIPSSPSNELKSKAMDQLVMTHGLRHENINPLIGWLSDPNRNAMVFEYCSRGSLQDVLIMDEIKLDWSFRLSLLTDLVRGMRYLHSSPLRVHGSLSSRNCVVDARWVLKITDYGLQSFAEAQGLAMPPKTAKAQLWTAPEILRNVKNVSKLGTQSGDVYSFGIIMQEVVVRGEPYCMLSLSPDEIISKIKKPPPLIRPSVSKGAAPPEAINIMRQCWAENPEMRPDFNSVYDRFKQLNHGRKVNFVDTMFQMLEKYSNNLEELIRERTEQLDIERKKTEQLLNRMLPSSVAEKLKVGLGVDPEEFSDVTIYFSDIVGFTTIAAHCSPVQVVDLLNDLYTCFDATINAYSVYKVETIGDAYMVVSGLPVRIPDHAEQIATMALDLLHQSGHFEVKHLPNVPLQLRIGLHTGPCCAGVVGLTMPRYCLFGDTVNTASRMESTGSSWRIHLSEVTRDRLIKAGGYELEPRGPIEIKGKGLMNTYWLLGKKGFDKDLPIPPPIGNAVNISRAKPSFSANHSSSRSSSLAEEFIDVKVEITPPKDEDRNPLPISLSMDSNTTPNLSMNLSDFKTPSNSPQPGKLQEPLQDGLLNPSSFSRFAPGMSSSNIFKKIEEMLDLSLPYNHYRCLSPSESNLTQFNEGKYVYGMGRSHTDSKPGSSRLLRRQFSLDKDDSPASVQVFKQCLEIPIVQDTRASPTNSKTTRLHKQHSASIAIDLEKIEEIPLSPPSLFTNFKSNDIMLCRIPGSEPGSPCPDDRNNGNINERREISLNVESLISR